MRSFSLAINKLNSLRVNIQLDHHKVYIFTLICSTTIRAVNTFLGSLSEVRGLNTASDICNFNAIYASYPQIKIFGLLFANIVLPIISKYIGINWISGLYGMTCLLQAIVQYFKLNLPLSNLEQAVMQGIYYCNIAFYGELLHKQSSSNILNKPNYSTKIFVYSFRAFSTVVGTLCALYVTSYSNNQVHYDHVYWAMVAILTIVSLQIYIAHYWVGPVQTLKTDNQHQVLAQEESIFARMCSGIKSKWDALAAIPRYIYWAYFSIVPFLLFSGLNKNLPIQYASFIANNKSLAYLLMLKCEANIILCLALFLLSAIVSLLKLHIRAIIGIGLLNSVLYFRFLLSDQISLLIFSYVCGEIWHTCAISMLQEWVMAVLSSHNYNRHEHNIFSHLQTTIGGVCTVLTSFIWHILYQEFSSNAGILISSFFIIMATYTYYNLL